MNALLLFDSSGGFPHSRANTVRVDSVTSVRTINFRDAEIFRPTDSSFHGHWNVSLIPLIAVDFPAPETIGNQAWDTAWPEVLKFGGACIGILLAAHVIRSFRNQ